MLYKYKVGSFPAERGARSAERGALVNFNKKKGQR